MEATQEILKGMSPETAQRKGRTLFGLRCIDMRGGLLGKQILTLEMVRETLHKVCSTIGQRQSFVTQEVTRTLPIVLFAHTNSVSVYLAWLNMATCPYGSRGRFW